MLSWLPLYLVLKASLARNAVGLWWACTGRSPEPRNHRPLQPSQMLFVVYLWHPKWQGAFTLYESVIRPQLQKHERQIDETTEWVKTHGAKASTVALLLVPFWSCLSRREPLGQLCVTKFVLHAPQAAMAAIQQAMTLVAQGSSGVWAAMMEVGKGGQTPVKQNRSYVRQTMGEWRESLVPTW